MNLIYSVQVDKHLSYTNYNQKFEISSIMSSLKLYVLSWVLLLDPVPKRKYAPGTTYV